jgi:hypothetical protein
MNSIKQRKICRVLFDEFHSESWSVSLERARQVQPGDPSASSYQKAADALSNRDFLLERNTDHPLTAKLLSETDVLVILHPCDPKWESTVSTNSPQLSSEEIQEIHRFVREGGSLIVVTEYEHDKYGDNLNELLSVSGLEIENTTVSDPSTCHHENPTWLFGEPAHEKARTSHLVGKACFYRAASCRASGDATIAWQASSEAKPKNAGLIGLAQYGKGRVVVVTDSSLFGDKHVEEFDHLRLWLNLFYWCSVSGFARTKLEAPMSEASRSAAWLTLKSTINQLRLLQKTDGSIEPAQHGQVQPLVKSAINSIEQLKIFFPHQKDYLQQVLADFATWIASGFQKPDFGKSLAAFNPQAHRIHNIEHLVVFPLYTPNASKDTRFEALLIRVPWPDWLAHLEKTTYPNDKFAPGNLVDFTEGYNSECAVLFPETVSLTVRPSNNFATIFHDREAKRLQSYSLRAASIVRLDLHSKLECFLNALPLIQDTTGLWDLIHDKSHSVGELPFDPFMIRQKAPFWMYGLEELRVDLRSFVEATRLTKEGFPFAEYVTYAILFDRIFRFPITGPRVRNYDALGGQLLFSFLHQKDILIWSDNKLVIRWDLLFDGMNQLREEIVQLYKHGADCSKLSFWINAHDLVSKYVSPNVASKWKKDSREVIDETDPKKWISLVHDDEFPLGNFHLYLMGKMSVSAR